MAATVCLCGLLAVSDVLAGVPVDLPDGEDPARWRSAFELTELELADDDAAITIRVDAGRWVVTARDDQGVLRRATVDPPTTQAEREEVAAIARGIARALGLAEVTPESRPPPPPPPPPLEPEAEPEAPASVRVDPPEGTADRLPPVIVNLVPVEEGTSEAEAPPDEPADVVLAESAESADTEGESTAEPSETPAVEEVSEPVAAPGPPRRPLVVTVPRLHVGGVVAVRASASPGVGVAGGIEVVRWQRFRLDLHLLGLATRALPGLEPPDDFLLRRMGTWTVDLDPAIAITPGLTVGAVVGGSGHAFRQQGVSVERVLTPTLGVTGAGTVRLPVGWGEGLGLRVGVRGIADLVPVVLRAEDGSVSDLPMFEAQLVFSVAIPSLKTGQKRVRDARTSE